MKYYIIGIFVFACYFSRIQPMYAPQSIQCLAESADIRALLALALGNKKSGNYLEAIVFAQRYQIRVTQDGACCNDKSARNNALLNLKKLFSDDESNSYITQMSSQDYY